ncbi:fungal-specific transcription factor domain-containing protein [Aspergillus pseudotamarii]|uniref:Fungal-specific transcription factor domain-containing protein n=1 Tax=Aspergillus pseudotamarii TaxID=132259 RepID=A0A5N6T4P9_ASPPS|nr:fungal-specific transcription factor domain-containing protein [Aspergillus pseudotamarii]KAE8141288.1 fungal-specific transcription factor domain-containing protein [Aspergillus pseudotamarii]
MHACDRCHRRKSKCDKVLPACGPCQKAGVACKYVDRTRSHQQLLEKLQRRLKQVEATNRTLAARLASHASPAAQSEPEEDSNEVGSEMPILDNARGEATTRRHEREEDENEIIEEVTFLSSGAGGEQHFLGSASGVFLASLVSATMVSSRPQGSHEKSSRRRSSRFPPLSPGTNASSEASALPTEQVARNLHRAYFEHDHLCYPFLHRETTLRALDQAYQDPNFLEQDAFASFVFEMILAIATASVHKFNIEALPDAEAYQVRATQRLNEVIRDGGVQALQALLLLCQYRMTNSIQDTSTSLWHIVGVASRMCFELGLHREQTYRPVETIDTSDKTSYANIECDIRRQCFWCVVAMDRIVSITLGRPLAIHLQDVEVSLPDSRLDTAWDLDNIDLRHQSSSSFSRTALFVHIVRYRVICGDILSALHNTSSRTQGDATSALEARDKLATDLVQWHHETAALSLPEINLSNPLLGDQSSYRAREWYELLYYNALLMLYRPSPALSSAPPQDAGVLQTIFVAAKQSITLYSHLHRSRRINYTWITLHSVFMAGLSYVYAVGRHFRARKRETLGRTSSLLQSDPTIMEIVHDSRACSNVLVGISERWNVTKHCHDVFNRLTDAMLTDAIEYHSRSTERASTQPTSTALRPDEPLLPAEHAAVSATPNIAPPGPWDISDPSPISLGIDSVVRECFDDLRRFQMLEGQGDDPVGRLFHDWLGEISDIDMNLTPMW